MYCVAPLTLDEMVMFPAFENDTVPEVYVASETMIPEIPVCTPPAFAPDMTMLLDEPEMVILFPPLNQISVPCADDVVPEVLPVSFQFWLYFEVSPDRAAVVR